jgi:catechol-2,3-dioxygenase
MLDLTVERSAQSTRSSRVSATAPKARGVYFEDPNGHMMEIITRPYGDRPEQTEWPASRRPRADHDRGSMWSDDID